MYILADRVYSEMRSEEASLWYVQPNNGEELAVLINAPTSSIKALIAGCPLKLVFGRKDSYLCTGVAILDIPDAPIVISGLQREPEEHRSLIRALTERRFPIALFNEMDVCLARATAELTEEDATYALDFVGPESLLYTGPFTTEGSCALDCFCFSMNCASTYPDAHVIPTAEITATLERWQIIHNCFIGVRGHHTIAIDEKIEGEMLERAIWASLESVFPLTLHKSPQVRIGTKMRELTDVFSFYMHGSFLIEAKDLSVLSAGYHRDRERRTKGIQKQVKKAIAQLTGASRAFAQGYAIFEASGTELSVDRKQLPHCIILITELIHWGNWGEIETQLIEAMRLTRAFFHLLDLREFIALLKGSAGKAELLDYNLIERWKLFIEKRSIFIRSR